MQPICGPNVADDQSSERTKESSGRPEAPELRLVLLGDSGAEKSAVGNIILGREAFSSDPGSETKEIQKRKGLVEGWSVAMVDAPDLSSTNVSGHWRRRAINQCVNLSAPGPHAFLLVLPLGGGAGEAWESLERGVEMFGEEAWGYTMALFTGRGEEARGATAEECLQSRGEELRRLAGRCGKGCHVLDCEDMEDRAQVAALLEKIQTNLPYYNNSAYRNAESKINRKKEEILREKQGEKQREEDKHRRKYEKELDNWKQKMQAEIREKEDKIREQEDRIAELEKRLAGEGDRERIRTLEAELRRERAERERLEQEVDGLKREMEKERREREERHRRELEEIRRGYEERAREEAERDAECAEVFGRLDTETEAAAGGTTEGRRASAHRRRQTACCSIS
ncbi:GTPase IMAP family member 4-like [Lepisosteus oculatus]|uniref:GTPase IMAP family member 4-like n=1 Tax=Lepisosteus oculatus TaxID=7918 RepID=UPI00371E187C